MKITNAALATKWNRLEVDQNKKIIRQKYNKITKTENK